MDLRVVLRRIGLHERVVSDCKGQPVQALELEFIEWVRAVYDWVVDLLVLFYDGFTIGSKGLLLFLLKLLQLLGAFHQLDKLASEGRNLRRVAWVEDEVHDSLASTLDEARLFSSHLFRHHAALDTHLFLSENFELIHNDTIEHLTVMI